MTPDPITLSVLDLVPVRTGATARDAMQESVDLARLAERLGFVRYWFAEHHGMASIASSVPEIRCRNEPRAAFHRHAGAGREHDPKHRRRSARRRSDDHVDRLRSDGALSRLRVDCAGTRSTRGRDGLRRPPRRGADRFLDFDALWPYEHDAWAITQPIHGCADGKDLE
jgi:hypothetical protein